MQSARAKFKGRLFILSALFCLVLLWGAIGWGREFPPPLGYVSDYAGIIAKEQERLITELATEVERKTTAEIAVVTVKTVEPWEYNIYANKLFQEWGIGKKGKDNGVLILVALKERKVRIEVGYGLEGVLTDGRCGEIIDRYLVPYFRKERYGEGLYEAVRAIANLLAQEYKVKLVTSSAKYPSGDRSSRSRILKVEFLVLAINIMVWVMILVGIFYGGRRKGRRVHRGYWSGGSGGFGGGGGGFGGGSSGGGGAGRGW